jgi:putative YhdH/YhfP family quinone oxidoreductase
MGTKPLERTMWAGAVDAVGGDVLAWLMRTMMYGGAIASSGLTAGTELKTTVPPFILRGVKLFGIDSVACPMAQRLDVWKRLANDLKPKHLRTIAHEVDLGSLPTVFPELLAGSGRGRTVVRIG